MSSQHEAGPSRPQLPGQPWNLGHLRRLLDAHENLPDNVLVLVYAMPLAVNDRERRHSGLLTMVGAGPGGRRVDRADGPAHERIFVIRCDYPAPE